MVAILRDQPDVVMRMEDLHEALKRRGWHTTAENPRNLVANLAGKASQREPAIRRGPKRGTYVWVSDGNEGHATPAHNDSAFAEEDADADRLSARVATEHGPVAPMYA